MSTGGKRAPGRDAGKSHTKTSPGAREFARRTRAQSRREARRQMLRNRVRAGAGHTPTLVEFVRRMLGRIPTAARVCALVAFLNAVCWSLITPPFQSPDEPDHFAYVQQLAETGHLPQGKAEGFSPEEQAALRDLRQVDVLLAPAVKPISSRSEQHTLESDLSEPLTKTGSGERESRPPNPRSTTRCRPFPMGLGRGGRFFSGWS